MPRSRPSRYVNRGPSRVLAVGFLALTLGVGCQAALTPAPTSSATVEASPTATPSATTTATPTTTATGSPTAASWQAVGSLTLGRTGPHAVRLGDGRVLVVGNEGGLGARADSVRTEIWDPASNAWTNAASLNKPRGLFAAVALADGRALVIGGLDQGTSTDSCGNLEQGQQSFSSTWAYDPRPGQDVWSRTGLLGTARTAPAAAVLPDGRVLVAGGYYHTGSNERGTTPARAELAALRTTASDAPAMDTRLADVEAPPVGVALATAELYDPTTDRWSTTGALTYARVGASAATLADGRVLIVGSGQFDVSKVAEQAYDNAEIYDPRTGRFSLAGQMPDIDGAALAKLGVVAPAEPPQVTRVGTLVPLLDGGAVLIGNGGWWKHEGDITRSFRYDARTNRWTEIGQPYAAVWNNATVSGDLHTTPGVPRLDALVARLPDGRILVAGGTATSDGSPDGTLISRSAEAYDPTTNRWAPLPSMPEVRAGGAAVVLTDGSVLVVGGYNSQTMDDPCAEPYGLASAIRFVPSR